jgi:hypothetical protein
LEFAAHETLANELDGHFASIQSSEENWLVTYINDGRQWIGFSDTASEGSFTWTDGSQVNFTSWYTNEPNDDKNDEDCTVNYWKGVPNKWNDLRCNKTFPAVYKLPASRLCDANGIGYKCYNANSTGCSSTFNCRGEIVCG